MDEQQEVFGRGLANYGAEEVLRVQGLKTSQITRVLGSKPYDEIIQRDNMVIFQARSTAGSSRGSSE